MAPVIGITTVAGGGSETDALKIVGIVALWSLALALGRSVPDSVYRAMCFAIACAGVILALIAYSESVVRDGSIQSGVAATVGEAYEPRPNLLLGEPLLRAQGTLGYPIPFAHFGLIVFAVALSGVIARRWLAASVASSGVVIMALSGTRASVGAGAVVVGVWVILHRRRLRVAWLAAIPVVWALVVEARDILSQMLSSADNSLVHRLNVAGSALNVGQFDPVNFFLGSGYNSPERIKDTGFFDASATTTAPDNAYVSLLLTGGLYALVVVVGVLGRAMVGRHRASLLVLAGSLTFFLVYDAVWWHAISFLVFFFAGVGLRPVQGTERE